MTPVRRAVVVGGSLGGLVAANLLHRHGWQVSVCERTTEALTGRGTGIVTYPELLDVLQQAGAAVDAGIGVQVRSRIMLARDGGITLRCALPQTLTAWGKLYQLLRDAFPGEYRIGTNVAAVEQHADAASVYLQDGTTLAADVVIAADGFRSILRRQFLPAVRLQYAGYIAWRGLVEESAFCKCIRALLFDAFSFCLPPHEQMLGYPVAGANGSTRPGERRWNFVWYRATDAERELPDLLTDATGRIWKNGIPPGRIRPAVLADMQAAAQRLLAPQFAVAVRHTVQPLFQPIFDLEVPRMAFGRVALLGDAAFVARPHCGMGVTKAASDALSLVQALQANADVPTGLQMYSARRTPIGRAIVQHARRLGAYMQAQLRDASERQMAERYRTPESVMRETAVARQF